MTDKPPIESQPTQLPATVAKPAKPELFQSEPAKPNPVLVQADRMQEDAGYTRNEARQAARRRETKDRRP